VSAERPGLVLRHSLNCHAGRFGEWAAARELDLIVHHSWETPPDLDPADYRFVVGLGSASSVNDVEPAWIATELAFLRRCVDAELPVLGLCWGGQALSALLGASVVTSPAAEKGWLAIVSSDPEIPAGPWAHYHSESFTVPNGATELARTAVGPSAYRIGPHLAVQFHPEATPEILNQWAGRDPGRTAADRDRIAAEGQRWGEAARALAFELFDAWWARISVPAAS
jgi:GMP synthase-like glutamine amidotransferase